MNDDFLKIRLRRVARRYHWLAFWRKLAVCWAIAALAGVALVLLQRAIGWSSVFVLPTLAALAGAAATALAVRHFERQPDPRWIAQKIEKKYPELNGLLLTAVQNGPAPGGEPGFLQDRLLRQATAASQQRDWREVVPVQRLVAGHLVHLVALACFLFALDGLRAPVERRAGQRGGPGWMSADGVNVTPGDTELERGESLVVLAHFGKTLPATVNLIVREQGAAERTIPLVKSLADPIFGGSVADVTNDFTYRLEYRGEQTRDFKVKVFEHPRMVRADVDLTFPDYTKLARKHIQDTRRVSAVEGTKLDYVLHLNKPVKTAKLVARDAQKTEIALAVDAAQPVANLAGFVPAKSATYDLQLVDADGRANKLATPFVIDVQPNRPPEIRLASPRGDVRPSALEEVLFDGTIWDDFGAIAYGLAYMVGGGEPRMVDLGRDVPAKEKRSFDHLLNLETLGAKPDDLIAWHAWAEDIGPDGKVRRTRGDLYFAEVRPFDEIFRESQNQQSPDQQGGGGGNERRRLTELQKQIINATWRLQRDGATPKYVEDARIVRESQGQLLDQARALQGESTSPREQALWREATQHMIMALDRLKDAALEPAPLAQALPAEQAAYQALLKLSARETNVTRQQGGGGGGGQQANQRQIDQLDLKQSENRYETQRQARAPENQQRLDQLAVMNRLQELARRQEDLNERLKELQTALQEAKTEEEREELRRRLKRLEEEQRQMLADADEIRQRMDRAQDQASMAEQRRQLEETREELQRAAEAAGQGSVAQALSSGTRAQRQLQEMRDELRKQNSSQFAEDLREMRNEARELANAQDELTRKIEELGERGAQRRTLSDSGDRKELLDELATQKERMKNLVDRAQQVSEQAENSEPLLSRQLYDSVRKVSQDDANSVRQARQELLSSGLLTRDLANRLQQAGEREGGGKILDVTSEMLREGYLRQARQSGQQAKSEIEELRQGVERAAESVLGDDAEQLRLAQSELDRLTELLQREMQQARGGGQTTEDGERTAEGGGQTTENGERTAEGGGRTTEEGERMAGDGQRGADRGEQERGDAEDVASAEARAPRGESGESPGEGDPNERVAGGAESRTAQSGQEGERAGDSPSERASGERGGERQRGSRGQNRNGPLTVNDLLSGGDGGDGGGSNRGGRWDNGAWLGNGPLMGADFGEWADRLRDVEDLLESPDLRNAVAAARERARLMRRDYSHDLKKPDWAVVQLEIVKPLVEVRTRVAEELARRGSRDSLAPIDRDPVPNKYAESVRRYYEELGKDGERKEAAP